MPSGLDNIFGIHERSLLLRSRRATLLASNLANVDTPNYKAKDLDFKSLLNNTESKAGKNIGTSRVQSHSQHISVGDSQSIDGANVKYRNPHQPSLDGNTVENHIEQGRFSENAVRYQASLQFIGAKSKGLIRALRGE